jgi:hypothetical protein
MRDSATDTTVELVLRHVRSALRDIEKSYRAKGRSVAELGAEQLAERMVAAVPLPSPVNDGIGPFYRGEQVAKLLQISRQAVHERAKKGSLLALRTADDLWVYPTFQFKGRSIISGLQEVLAEFRQAQPDRWAIAGWLVSPTAALAGQSPLDALRSNGELAPVIALAQDAVLRWTQ